MGKQSEHLISGIIYLSNFERLPGSGGPSVLTAGPGLDPGAGTVMLGQYDGRLSVPVAEQTKNRPRTAKPPMRTRGQAWKTTMRHRRCWTAELPTDGEAVDASAGASISCVSSGRRV
jgi:hypothetical protein